MEVNCGKIETSMCNKAKYKLGLRHVVIFASLLIVVYHICAGILLNVGVENTLRSIYIQIFGLLLPGIALYVLLYEHKQNIIAAIVISYSLGYVSNIVSYFLLMPFGLSKVIPFFVVALAVFSVMVILKKGTQLTFELLEKGDVLIVIIFFAYLVLQFVTYSGCNVSPQITGSAWYPTDIMHWIGNAASLAIKFPATEIRASLDVVVYYHYFTSIQLAFLNLATGVDLFTLAVPLFSLGKSILYFGSFYILLKGITKSIWVQVLGIVAICFCTGVEGAVLPTVVSHTWTHPFGFDIGLAYGAIFLHCFYLQFKKKEFDKKIWILSIITFAASVGLKAPVGAIVMVAAGIICFGWLMDKHFKLAFSYGIGLLMAFLLIAIGCVGLLGSAGESVTGGFSLWATLREFSPYFRTSYEMFLGEWPGWIKGIILSAVYCIFIHPIIIGIYILGAISILIDGEMRNAQNIGAFLAGAVGLMLGLFNLQSGHSQVYFSMSAFIPCLVLGVNWIEHRRVAWDLSSKRQNGIICVVILLVQMCALMYQGYTYWGRGLVSALRLGYTNLFEVEDAQQEFRIDGIQAEDVEALAWIRDNTPRDSVLLVDRSVLAKVPGYMFYSAFSERQIYLEGDIYYRERYTQEREYMRQVTGGVFQNSEVDLQAAIEDGVDYVVQTKWLTPDFVASIQELELIYSSETINVYEVVQ